MEKRLEQFYSLIIRIPLFSRLDGQLLKIFLQNCQIKEFKKNQKIFEKNDKITHCHFLLKGKVKLCVTNFEGAESIIKLLNFGDDFDEMFNNFHACDAVAVSDCILLIFKIDFWQKEIDKNSDFARLLLEYFSKKIHHLNSQNIDLKQANAKEKLGNYLLNEAFVKNSAKKSQEFSLNYDKAKIASYLGMKPETMSRQLNKLKEDGEIKIKKNSINLTAKNSLCRYCNKEIAQKCHNHKEDFCEQ